MLVLLLCVLIATPITVAQSSVQKLSFESMVPGGERTLKFLTDQYAIPDLAKIYRTRGQLEISDLRPMMPWFYEQHIVQSSRQERATLLRNLIEEFSVAIKEDENTRTTAAVEIRIQLLDSYEAARKQAAFHLANLSVSSTKGSFSGVVVGDWTASYNDGDLQTTINFLRKNAFVQVFYDSPGELFKNDKTRPRRYRRDPTTKYRCEQLAREIDEQLLRLPGPEAK